MPTLRTRSGAPDTIRAQRASRSAGEARNASVWTPDTMSLTLLAGIPCARNVWWAKLDKTRIASANPYSRSSRATIHGLGRSRGVPVRRSSSRSSSSWARMWADARTTRRKLEPQTCSRRISSAMPLNAYTTSQDCWRITLAAQRPKSLCSCGSHRRTSFGPPNRATTRVRTPCAQKLSTQSPGTPNRLTAQRG